MYHYAVGQKVKVRKRLEEDKEYRMFNGKEVNYINSDMRFWEGEMVTIVDYDGGQYRIKEDEEEYFWTDEMFEDKETEQYEQLFCGKQIVRVDNEVIELDDGEVYHVFAYDEAELKGNVVGKLQRMTNGFQAQTGEGKLFYIPLANKPMLI